MIEKPLQDYYINFLESENIPYIHIPNRTFGKWKTPKCLKYFPDIDFQYGGIRYQREFGIKVNGKVRHSERKEKQSDRMYEYYNQGADVDILFTMDEVKEDIKKVFGYEV